MAEKQEEVGHVFGNFQHYYHFHPIEERIKCLSSRNLLRHLPSLETPFLVCDVGCNSGQLTNGVYQLLTHSGGNISQKDDDNIPFYDENILNEFHTKIQKEKRTIRYEMKAVVHPQPGFTCDVYLDYVYYGTAYGLSKTASKVHAIQETLKRIDIIGKDENKKEDSSMENKEDSPVKSSEPKVVEMMGMDLDVHLIEKATRQYGKQKQLLFMEGDIMEEKGKALLKDFLNERKRESFDLITCFSMTMWIHLNHGDTGLLSFLSHLAKHTQCLILEPQAWKSYTSAIRRIKKMSLPLPKEFLTMKIRADVQERMEEHLITQCGFHFSYALGKSSWKRPLRLYSKVKIDHLEQ